MRNIWILRTNAGGAYCTQYFIHANRMQNVVCDNKPACIFFLKKTKLLKNGEASVCMRFTVDGTRVENNIRKSIDPSLWSQAKESARGKSRKSCDLNAYIENARIKLHQI